MPRISPGATVNDSPSTARSRRDPETTRSRTSSSGVAALPAAGEGAAASRAASTTSRPTIALAIAPGVVVAVAIRSTVVPARITVMVSETSTTSSSLCVINTTVPPFARSVRSTVHSSFTSGGDSTAVGSSRISSFAPR